MELTQGEPLWGVGSNPTSGRTQNRASGQHFSLTGAFVLGASVMFMLTNPPAANLTYS